MKRLIIFLIRKRLGLKRGECFRFANQASDKDYYYFAPCYLVKVRWSHYWKKYISGPSSCSLNWILDENCVIKKVDISEGEETK